jgi:hypothetical protein
MKMLKRSVMVALLLFVGATVGMLVAQEVSRPPAGAIADGTSPQTATVDGGEVAAAVEDWAPQDDETAPVVEEVAAVVETGESKAETTSAEAAEAGTENAKASCVVDAIYFHNTVRCRTCINIEGTARAVMEAEFTDEFASGRMRWSSINMEKQRQYVEQYALVKPTLILVRSVDDEPQDWVALDETWSLIGYESRFSSYVKDSTLEFLEGCR